jgi:hypothetical protein
MADTEAISALMNSMDGKIPKHPRRQMVVAFSRCNDKRHSIWLRQYRSTYEELHVVRASTLFFWTTGMRESATSGTQCSELHGKNFLDAIQSVGYNTSLYMPPCLRGAPVTARCWNVHAPASSLETVQRLASRIAEEP